MAEKDIKYALVPLTRAECDLLLDLVDREQSNCRLDDRVKLHRLNTIKYSLEQQKEFNWTAAEDNNDV